MSPLVFPKFAILDPQVTYSLPERQVANGVVDSFIHVVEQYLTYPVNAKVQDYFAEGQLWKKAARSCKIRMIMIFVLI